MRYGQQLSPLNIMLEVSDGSRPEEPSKQGKTSDRNNSKIYARPAALNGSAK
jgi:hypothetical protein